MSSPTPKPLSPEQVARERARLRRTVLILAPSLIIAGILIIAFLARIPMPVRLLMGFGNIIVGLVLLLLLKQKYFDQVG
ncbi:MAG TPA: hypothetical protein VGE76_13560 [Opitutaceae bacterium]